MLRKVIRKATSSNILTPLYSVFKRNYDKGDYEATVDILNENRQGIFVDTFNDSGIKLSNGIRILGPSILFPTTFLSWNVKKIEDVNTDSLSIFTILEPKLDILIVGVGDHKDLKKIKLETIQSLRKNKINLEFLPTEHALSTFNFLNSERRLVACAYIPPSNMETLLTGNEEDISRLLANIGDDVYIPTTNRDNLPEKKNIDELAKIYSSARSISHRVVAPELSSDATKVYGLTDYDEIFKDIDKNKNENKKISELTKNNNKK